MQADRQRVRLPIVIGVTGHRTLRPQDCDALEREVDALFERFARAYPSTPLLLLTPLAEGADRLVAQVARRRGIAYRVPMPLPLESYRADFTSPESLAAFDELLRGADAPPYAMPFYSGNDACNVVDEERRRHQYAMLDAYLARSTHVLIALWDGLPSDTIGGTAQAVRFRVLGAPKPYLHEASVIDALATGTVQHIYAPRPSTRVPARAVGSLRLRLRRESQPGESVVPASPAELFAQIDDLAPDTADPFETLYRRIESFNCDCASLPEAGASPRDRSAAASLQDAAERLASRYQRKYITALQFLFFGTGVAVLAFEVYSHLLPNVQALLVIYFLAFAFAFGTYVRARRGRWQDRAQDYRALEIGLSLQRVWDAVGLGESVADYYIRRQRTELDWIRDAIRTAHDVDRGRPFDEENGIATVRAFVLDQYNYFRKRGGDDAGSEKRKGELHENISEWSLRVSLAFSALLVIFGLLTWLRPELVRGIPETLWQAGSIFVIATTAVSAAFFHDYAARRAHSQHARRYEIMAGVYGRALNALDAADRQPVWRHAADGPPMSRLEVARECILELGREALIENGDWLLLHRELPIELLPAG